ncbi:hypothetical protein AL755_03675 (plasmid) [Arthrobacter sp. ERGS1:01]|nr:hypothetical protein AL755_03675 [Arthrobacter sp. ERGS1:01]
MARMKVDQLRTKLGDLSRELKAVDRSAKSIIKLVVDLHEGQAWKALGLPSWEALIESEHLRLVRLARPERTKLVREMAQQHFSSYAMAPVLGASASTIQRDVKILSQEQDKALPLMIRSLDGLTRPRNRRDVTQPIPQVLSGQGTLDLGTVEKVGVQDGLNFDMEGFLAEIGGQTVVDETTDQLVMAEAISADLQHVVDSLGALGPDRYSEHHRQPLWRLLQNTESTFQQAKELASQWGLAL